MQGVHLSGWCGVCVALRSTINLSHDINEDLFASMEHILVVLQCGRGVVVAKMP